MTSNREKEGGEGERGRGVVHCEFLGVGSHHPTIWSCVKNPPN